MVRRFRRGTQIQEFLIGTISGLVFLLLTNQRVPSSMRICRVLRPGGWALLSVPIFGETTVEHGTGGFIAGVPTHGLHADNARRTFGDDFEAIVREAGFSTRRFYGPELIDAAALERAKVVEMSSPVFLCTRV